MLVASSLPSGGWAGVIHFLAAGAAGPGGSAAPVAGVGLGALGGAGVTVWMLRRRPAPSQEPRSAGMIQAGSIAEALGALAACVCDVHDALLLADEHRHLVEVNDRACALYGYTRAEMLGMTITDLIPPEGLAACESRLKELDQSGFLSRETTHRRKDGTTIPVEVRLRRMEIGGRRFLGSVVRDISDRARRTELAHLAARHCHRIARFAPQTTPDSPEVVQAIENALA